MFGNNVVLECVDTSRYHHVLLHNNFVIKASQYHLSGMDIMINNY